MDQGEERKMTAKEYLERARELAVRAEGARRRAQALRALAEGSSRAPDRAPGGSAPKDRLGAVVACMVDMEEEMEDCLTRQEAVQKEMAGKLRCLAGDKRIVLELRYLCGMTFAELAEKLCYSERHVYRVHKKALEEMEKLM